MSRSELHIALCTDGVFPHAVGGMQRHSRLLAVHMATIPGVRLTVIHPHAAPIYPPALGIHEVGVPPIDTDKFYLGQLWKYSGDVAAALDRERPDVIIAQGFSVWKHIDRYRTRLMVHPHGLEMFQGITLRDRLLGTPFRITLRWIMRRSAMCISLGGRLTTMLERCVRGARTEVVVIPNAVELSSGPVDYPLGEGPLRLLFVGRFAFNKGLDLLLAVARKLEAEGHHDRVQFKLVGDGPLMASIRADGVPANVEILGKLDDDALDQAYRWSHALLLPTRFEGMPTVVLEAMARGRAILVSDVGATAELVDDTNGFLLPKGDEAALYSAIDSLALMDGAAREAMGRASLRRVEERYAWNKVAERTVEVSQKLAQREMQQRE